MRKMIYSEVGSAKDKISRLGFGLMRFPETDGKIDRTLALPMIDRAYQAGVNYFDTGYDYHGGDCEPFAGEALSRYPRDSYFLAAKMPSWLLESEADVPRIFEEQLKNCRVDYFDYYLLHAVDGLRWPAVKKARACEQMFEWKRTGRIRRVGFSFHGTYEAFCEIIDAYDWNFVQIQINYVDYDFIDAKALYNKICEKGLPCFVMEPIRGGFLANLPDVGRRELEKLSSDSSARWALRWCMDQSNMPVILSGMTTMAQLEENLETFGKHTPLSEGEYAALDRAVEEILKIKTIPCTRCGYCMDSCPVGVKIRHVFKIYNDYMLFKNAFRGAQSYFELGDGNRADDCIACGACSPMCPQDIDIPARLEEAHKTLSALSR